LELVHLTHSIPDMRGVLITTELGSMLMTGDYKFDQTPVDGRPADISRLAEIGRDGLMLLCGDSTNADRPGVAPSESSVALPCCSSSRSAPGGSSSPPSPPTSTASSR